jgi:hypothetical protein
LIQAVKRMSFEIRESVSRLTTAVLTAAVKGMGWHLSTTTTAGCNAIV